MTFLIIVIPLSVLAHSDIVTVILWLGKMWKTTQCSPADSDVETTASMTWPGCCWLQLLLTFLKGVTLYLVMGDGESLHERSDWGDQVDGVIHNLYQLFGVGALAHRGLPLLHRGLVRGSFPAPHHHDPNEMLAAQFCILGYGGCKMIKARQSFE